MISQILSFLFGNLDSKDIKRKEELKETALEISRNALRQYNKQKDGYVYVISNPAWKGWYKVGMAVDSQDRCGSYQTSSPHRDYRLEYSKYFLNRKVAEEIAKLQAEHDSKQYQRDRETSYPSIQEQLDMQYWDAVNGTKKWQEAIAKVKTENPKSE